MSRLNMTLRALGADAMLNVAVADDARVAALNKASLADIKTDSGEKKITVTPQTVIAAVAPGTKDELQAGAPIIIMASEKRPDGSVLAKTIYVGRNVVPAM